MTEPGASAPAAVVMVRPHHFFVNQDTALDNAFQSDDTHDPAAIAESAYAETTALADALRARGVVVHLFDDVREDRPDAIFPNNWLSTHEDGRIAVYPMRSPQRRGERRADIIQELQEQYRVTGFVDYSGLERENLFLEGTGSLVLDHAERAAYVARSPRADDSAVLRFCGDFGYEPFIFDAVDHAGTPIYHTNVMMTIATEYALVVPEVISDAGRRGELLDRLAASGRRVIELTRTQLHEFAANAIELTGSAGRVLAMSTRAHDSLTPEQLGIIEASSGIVAVPVPTAELAGGSVRCMIAGVHLPRR
jgi:hypothetical protein